MFNYRVHLRAFNITPDNARSLSDSGFIVLLNIYSYRKLLESNNVCRLCCCNDGLVVGR